MAFKKSYTRKKRTLRSLLAVKKSCHFCSEGINYIDYKDVKLMKKYLSRYMKIESRKRTGTCAYHQRALASALKRSRHLAMIPFVLK